MGHNITALITCDAFEPRVARGLDLIAVPLVSPLTLFHVDRYYAAYWQAIRQCTEVLDVPDGFPVVFPRTGVLVQLVCELVDRRSPCFALIQTDYFGGIGGQWACAYTGARLDSDANASINSVLRMLGVVRRGDLDEFDTIGLGAHRTSPDHLARYVELCDELGV
jgi:hypothetical protein